MKVFPVYIFEGYCNKVEIFHAFTSEAALDFALAAGNRYAAPSRIL